MRKLRFILLLCAVMSLSVSLAEKPLASAALNYAQLPLSFEANQGQAASAVKFLSRGSGYQLALTATEAVLQLQRAQTHSAFVKMKLVNADSAAPVSGRAPLPGKSNYFIGNDPRQWRTDVPHFAQVEYEQVWPGVNVVYYGNQRQLEYDFIVAPGADPRAIKLAFEGADEVAVNAQGELVLQVAGGAVAMHKPVVYQQVNGARQAVAGGYIVEGTQARFALGEYDASLPLVIDPVLSYSTYLGGSLIDRGLAITVDAAGSAYVTGLTNSTNFPTSNALNGTINTTTGSDVFITKLNPAGSALVYSTYLGGGSNDEGRGIAVDAQGNAYVTGLTGSTNFPTTAGAFDRTSENNEAFVTKLSPSGNTLFYSTLLGGRLGEAGARLAVDSAGSAYVVGITSSDDFPTTSGAFDRSLAGSRDGFVTKVNPAGSALIFSTYLGGVQVEDDLGIAIDLNGNAYVAGRTSSLDFPTTPGAYDTSCGTDGNCNDRQDDAFVTKFNAAGSALIYSTFLGASGGDSAKGIAVDATGNAYVTGQAGPDFPTTPDAFLRTMRFSGPFVTKLNTAGSALVYSTFLGSGVQCRSIAVDAAGNAHVVGDGGTGFTVINPLPGSNPAGDFAEAFITKLNATGSALIYSTYFGGRNRDGASDIAIDATGNAYVVGTTESTDLLTKDPLRPNQSGFEDAFIAKISDTTNCPALTGFATAPEADTLTLSNAMPSTDVPVSGATLKLGGLKVTASYRLESREDGLLIARLFDQAGNIRGDAGSLAIKKATSCTPTLPSYEFVFPRASLDLTPAVGGVEVTSLKLSVLMVSALDSSIIKRADVNYKVIPDAVAFEGTPKINGQDAPDGSRLPASGAINFTSTIKYHLTNDVTGKLRVQAFNANGGGEIASKDFGPVTATAQPTSWTTPLDWQFTVSANVSEISIVATLVAENSSVLKSSSPLFYRNKIAIVLGRRQPPLQEFFPLFSDGLKQGDPLIGEYDTLVLKAESLFSHINSEIVILLTQRLNNGEVVRGPMQVEYRKSDLFPDALFSLLINGRVPDDADKWEFQLLIRTPNQPVIESEIATVPINRLRIVPNNPPLDSTLIPGTRLDFVFSVTYNTSIPASIVAFVTYTIAHVGLRNERYVFINGDKARGASNQGEEFKFKLTLPADLVSLRIVFKMNSIESKPIPYLNFGVPPSTISAGPRQTLSGPGVDVTTIENTTNRPTQIGRRATAAQNAEEGSSGIFSSGLASPIPHAAVKSIDEAAQTAAPFKDFVGVNATWKFDPPIAANSGFVADLKFSYSAEDLPDDPNFNEAALKVIGFDPATGRRETYQTTLDLNAKTATARVNGLLPLYSLGHFGPFAQRSMYFPVLRNLDNFNTRLTFASVGNSAASLTTQAYAPTGKLYAASNVVNPLTQALPAGRTLTGLVNELFKFPSFADGGWLQTRVNKNFVAGYELLGKGERLDVLGAPAFYAGTQVLTDVSFDATRTTEIHLANVTRFDNAVTLEWRSATGALLATYETTLTPKESLAARVQDLFTAITQPFAGYVIVRGTHDLAAAALSVDAKEISALPGQVVLPSNTATKLYAPYVLLDGDTFGMRLMLVNPTVSAASLTLRLVNERGANLAAPVNLTLNPGQQYRQTLDQLFGLKLTAATFGSLVVESNRDGVAGAVTYFDPTGDFPARAALPLQSELSTALVFPYFDNRAGSYTDFTVFNPNAQTAQLTVKVFGTDGSQLGSANLSIPAGGNAGDVLGALVKPAAGQQGGYFTLTSNQPVLADGVFGDTAGHTLAALPTQFIETAPTAAPRALATVSAASFTAQTLAPESIVAAFGVNLSNNVVTANQTPLPLSLDGTTVAVRDSAETTRLAPLFFVAPGQINFQIPPGTANGTATIIVTNDATGQSQGTVTIASVAPGIFTANANGQGVPAAIIVRVTTNGAQTIEAVSRFDAATQRFVAAPIEFTPNTSAIVLVLFGTGWRGVSAQNAAGVTIGGTNAPLQYIGAQPTLTGLDQINVELPRALIGRGDVDLVLTVNGRAANTVRVNIK